MKISLNILIDSVRTGVQSKDNFDRHRELLMAVNPIACILLGFIGDTAAMI